MKRGSTLQHHSRFQIGLIASLVVLLVMVFVFSQNNSFSTRRRQVRSAIEQHDWQRFSELIPEENLASQGLTRHALQAFLDRYVGADQTLTVAEWDLKRGKARATIAVKYRSQAPEDYDLMEVDLTPRSTLPFLPPTADINLDFNMLFANVASHTFPDTDDFAPGQKLRFFLPPQLLFIVRERKVLASTKIPWRGEFKGGDTWDRAAQDLQQDLRSEGWDVQRLFGHYGLKDLALTAKGL